MEEIASAIAFAGLFIALAWYNAAKFTGEDPALRVERLAALRDAGHLDDAEFKRLKKRILNRI